MSLARELKHQAPGCQIIYIGHIGDRFDSLQEASHDFDFTAFIKAGKFRRYHNAAFAGQLSPRTLALNIRDLWRLPGSIVSAWKILRRFKPDVVFSKGGFVAVPVGLAAHWQGIPIVTHDSDSLPGLANRIIGRYAAVHATGMPVELYNYPASKSRHLGIPIDSNIRKITPKLQNQAKKILKLPPDSTVLLVAGGGNGSQRLNDLMVAISGELLETNLSLHIIHLTGTRHEAAVKAAYNDLPAAERRRVRAEGFNSEFHRLLAAADLIITRAGATTMAELAAAGKACIVIPAPFLAGGHQSQNAEALAENDAAVILSNDATPDELLAVTSSLLADDRRRFELARNLYATAKPDAAKELAELLLETAAAA